MPSLRSLAAFGALLVPALYATPARAEYPAPAFYLGLHGGANIVALPWDLGKNAQADGLQPAGGAGGMFGLRLGMMFTPQFGLELGGSMLPYSSTDDASDTALEYDLDGVIHFTKGDWAPFLLVGVGGYHQVAGDLTGDFDPTVHAGLGLRGLVAPWLALRIEARDVLSDGFTPSISNNIEARGAVDIFFAGTPDKDKDGIADKVDACPTVYGQSSANGCPDKDGDTVVDEKDTCPDVAGLVELGGCPDKDGDGITDAQDTCPAKPGPKELGGCPDSDGDKIADKDDTCPDVAGLAAFGGCPDTDNDGITDKEDMCPKDPGPKPTKGCPDRDHDGVVDSEDKCPDVTGLKKFQGCVPDEVKKYTGSIKGINFESGSAKILANSYPTLDNAVNVLKQYDELRLRIEGHTDDQGDDAMNLKLSRERAESVKAYLVSKGVDAKRLDAQGFGETRPIADNKTKAGRAQNRRIEFVIPGE